MYVTSKEMLLEAQKGGYAVGAFNAENMEMIRAIIAAAEELKSPVMIQTTPGTVRYASLETFAAIAKAEAEKASVPVAVHLDHGETVDYIYRALKMGFTSVMYDGSNLPFDENAANTRMVVDLAKKTGASVEAEIGSMGKRETGLGSSGSGPDPEKIYTDPHQAREFVELTGIDALACSFGTTHGVYLSKPKLDFSVVENVRKEANIPVVMHGGSGVSDEDFRHAIRSGVRKVNYYTYMALAGGQRIEDQFQMGCVPVEKDGKKYKYCYSLVESDKDAPVMYHDIVRWGTSAMRDNCRKAMKVFSMREA